MLKKMLKRRAPLFKGIRIMQCVDCRCNRWYALLKGDWGSKEGSSVELTCVRCGRYVTMKIDHGVYHVGKKVVCVKKGLGG